VWQQVQAARAHAGSTDHGRRARAAARGSRAAGARDAARARTAAAAEDGEGRPRARVEVEGEGHDRVQGGRGWRRGDRERREPQAGYHVHEKGDCSAPDASSAGGHFNPHNKKHGAPDGEERHEGDFGNLTAGKDGKATKTFVMKGITLSDGPTSIIGKGFIVHDKKDDFKTQPTGNAGGRVACGVITLNP
jgi:Cu/Zn superoxide dismutase